MVPVRVLRGLTGLLKTPAAAVPLLGLAIGLGLMLVPVAQGQSLSPTAAPTADLCPNFGFTCVHGEGPCIFLALGVCQPFESAE